MLVVGIDENGLGPRLGPLVATATVIEVSSYDARRLQRVGKRNGVTDSKSVTAFGRATHAESIALALTERLFGVVPRDADTLLSFLAIDGLLPLRSPCPDRGSLQQCWGTALALPAFGGNRDEGHRALDRIEKAGVRFKRVRTAVVCAGVFNHTYKELGSKSKMDLALFERLITDSRTALRQELHVICGMVGGMRKYTSYFGRFKESDIVVCSTKDRNSARYHIRSVGDVSFEVDADNNHLPVSLASIVGKYVRELSVERLNRFYKHHDSSLKPASGYRDPVTKRFIAQTEVTRKHLKIADECFERVV